MRLSKMHDLYALAFPARAKRHHFLSSGGKGIYPPLGGSMQSTCVQDQSVKLEKARARGLGRRDLEQANLTIALTAGRAHTCITATTPGADDRRMKIAFEALAYAGGPATPELRSALSGLYDLPDASGHAAIQNIALVLQHFAHWTDKAPASTTLDEWRHELDDIATTFRFALQLLHAKRYRGARKQYDDACRRLVEQLPHLRS